MKNLLVIFGVSLGLCLVTADHAANCKLEMYAVPSEWTDMVNAGEANCVSLVKGQIQLEITAAMTYLAMGTHFARDTINRPGFSEFFFKAASEERQHAIKLIEYLLMRGELTKDFNKLIRLSEIKVNVTQNRLTPIDALKEALKLETQVTNSIKNMMDKCEEPANPEDKDKNDYHFVDYLTTEFLDEQYKGQRDLAGKISTLGKMIQKLKGPNGALSEFLFDKKLLNGEI